MFPNLEPWPQPVDGAALLGELAATFQRYAMLPEHADVVLALWVVFTYCIEVMDVAPILVLSSPEKRCGKTTVLTLLVNLVHRPLATSNISPAALFRIVEAHAPTLLIDEADTFVRDHEELRGIINSGHTRSTAYVIRTVGDQHEPRRFSTWGAKALACIGHAPGTIEDRAVIVSMRRKLPTETVKKLRRVDHTAFADLSRQCRRFVSDHRALLETAHPAFPDVFYENDRAADNWEPLLAIAGLAGGDWPAKARAAAEAYLQDGEVESQSVRVQLLADVRAVFAQHQTERLRSAGLVTALCALEERPWSEWSQGKAITPRQVAALLKPFDITPKTLRAGEGRGKGYEYDQFTDSFARYLPPIRSVPA